MIKQDRVDSARCLERNFDENDAKHEIVRCDTWYNWRRNAFVIDKIILNFVKRMMWTREEEESMWQRGVVPIG